MVAFRIETIDAGIAFDVDAAERDPRACLLGTEQS